MVFASKENVIVMLVSMEQLVRRMWKVNLTHIQGCKNNCNSQGTCIDGKCVCEKDYFGALCQHSNIINYKEKMNCSFHGVFNMDNQSCVCDDEYYGANCEYKHCLNNCNSNGLCLNNGECQCYSNYTGYDCSKSNHQVNWRKMHQWLFPQGIMYRRNLCLRWNMGRSWLFKK